MVLIISLHAKLMELISIRFSKLLNRKNYKKIKIILSTRVRSSYPPISIEFNSIDIDNIAGYKRRTRVLYMIQKLLTF